MLLNNKRLRSKYDPDVSYEKADNLAKVTNKAEADQWAKHPCTQELIHRLEGDMAGLLVGIAFGVNIDAGSADTTAQNTAKTTGQAAAIDEVLELIEAIRKKESYAEADTDTGV